MVSSFWGAVPEDISVLLTFHSMLHINRTLSLNSIHNFGDSDNIIESHPKVSTRFCSFLVFYALKWGRRISPKFSLFFLGFYSVYTFFILFLLFCLLIKFCFFSSRHPGSSCWEILYILTIFLGSPTKQNSFLNVFKFATFLIKT